MSKNEITSVKNALRILQCFQLDAPIKGVTDIAEETGISKSTVHRLLQTLQQEGFVKQRKNYAKYELGMTILKLHTIYSQNSTLYNATLDTLLTLSEQTNGVAHIAVFEHEAIVYLNKVAKQQVIELKSHIGHTNFVHCTATGRVLLAHQCDDVVQRVLRQPLKRFTPRTLIEPSRLYEELAHVRKQGYAVVEGEYNVTMTSMAVPIVNPTGHVIAAVNIVIPSKQLDDLKKQRYITLLQHEAMRVKKRLAAYR